MGCPGGCINGGGQPYVKPLFLPEEDEDNKEKVDPKNGFIPETNANATKHTINITGIEENSKIKYTITPLLKYAKLNRLVYKFTLINKN